ncbi:putative 60S ribosomal protein L25 [Talaromyces proteolyticus]|uniref:60S ribosomal protein L25 n=1 Tax=Talaromyces proteolyticus TaxID=1131652 RepID=A0AAD4KZR4_9EURO|nr:putative 60S ribosomal protein L25 [Talaromyces proteolyticus]KAH8700259.1 putative 60S ribosomal protein L25 [Talaromyces proteolyticus]
MSATLAIKSEAKSAARSAAKLAGTGKNGVVSLLPQRLLNFFAKYPPENYSAATSPVKKMPPGVANTLKEADAEAVSGESTTSELAELPSPYTPNRDAKGVKRDPTVWSPSKALLYTCKEFPNPFLPSKNPKGEWWAPKFGLRQQADLVKLAKKYGVEELLPSGRKSTIFKETRRQERGLAIKGTGIGQKVKGHKWERTMETRLEERRKAMMEMPELIRLWKQRGHGRGWKKWPKR